MRGILLNWSGCQWYARQKVARTASDFKSKVWPAVESQIREDIALKDVIRAIDKIGIWTVD